MFKRIITVIPIWLLPFLITTPCFANEETHIHYSWANLVPDADHNGVVIQAYGDQRTPDGKSHPLEQKIIRISNPGSSTGSETVVFSHDEVFRSSTLNWMDANGKVQSTACPPFNPEQPYYLITPDWTCVQNTLSKDQTQKR